MFKNISTIQFIKYYIYILQGGPKTGPFLKVYDSCIWWGRKAIKSNH